MRITAAIVKEIFEQGGREAPVEACGYLAGTGNDVLRHFPMKNTDRSNEHFSLDPREQFDVVRRARSEGLDILAVYHTHPATPARPSAEDIRLAYDPALVYVIASLLPESKAIKAFRIAKGEVTEEKLTVEEQL